MRRPPGPPPREGGIFSTARYAASFFFDPLGFVGERFARYGDVYNAPSRGTDLYVVRRPEHVREILVTQADCFVKTHTAFEALSRILGEGLLTTQGDVWRRHRRLANPAFAKRAIDSYVTDFAAESTETRDALAVGSTVDLAKEMTGLTLRVVGRTLLGAESVADVGKIARAMRVFQTVLAAPRSLPKLVRDPLDRVIEGAIGDLHSILDRAILARRGARRDPPDLMQMLLDASDPEDPAGRLTDREVKDELVTFLLAGHETTSNTLAWALYLLSQSPEAERRLIEEARALGNRPPTAADLERLSFSEMVVKEAMRLYPPAYILARRAASATILGDFDVAEGTEVVAWIYFTHRDPRVFEAPARFRPERFEPEAEAKLPRGAFLPFGAGPRACIGKAFAQAEATVALSTLYQTRRFEYVGKGPPKANPRITLSPAALPMRVVGIA
jgi:cytochrome P450